MSRSRQNVQNSAKKQGKKLFKKNDYETPLDAIRYLEPHIQSYDAIWECAGKPGRTSNITKYLKSKNYFVVETKKDDVDFLSKEAFEHAGNFDVIVTNPPFEYKTEFLKQAFQLEIPFAFLLPVDSKTNKPIVMDIEKKVEKPPRYLLNSTYLMVSGECRLSTHSPLLTVILEKIFKIILKVPLWIHKSTFTKIVSLFYNVKEYRLVLCPILHNLNKLSIHNKR